MWFPGGGQSEMRITKENTYKKIPLSYDAQGFIEAAKAEVKNRLQGRKEMKTC